MSAREPRLYGESPAMVQLRERLAQVAPTPLPVLLHGETGTGKEVAARWVHLHSARANGPFVAVDCAAISPTLVESELFGHERGAFTGANQRRAGLVAAAHRGTFFLDEIAELPLDAQTRLLRLLQEGTYRPVGAQEESHADLRVVAATWQDLGKLVREGRFRRDLYHRLAVVELRLPSLRERGPADIDLLVDRLMDDTCDRLGRAVPSLEPRARDLLRRWPWPGNVRELVNVVEYLCAMTRGSRVTLADLPQQLSRAAPGVAQAAGDHPPVRIDLPYLDARRAWLDAFQDLYVHKLLEAHEGNVSAASRAAQMDRRSIQRILARQRGESVPDEG
jgi:DNA-binding NtrC family response regulator